MQIVEQVTYSLNESEIKEAIKNYLIEKTELNARQIVIEDIQLGCVYDTIECVASDFEVQLTVTSQV
jgi:hypothetical protein